MSRPNIATLKPTASRRYWPSLAAPGRNGEQYETIEACHREDRLRASSSRKLASRTKKKSKRKAILSVARKLEYDARNKPVPKSLSSSLHLRGRRDAIFSQLWRLADKYDGPITTATAIKRGWEFTPETLAALDVKALLNTFLADLDRRGATEAKGWLIAFVHGEWETPLGLFRLHLHMIVAGNMIKVVDRLRTGSKYKYRKDDNVRFRVRIDRKPLTNLPYPFTYCFKAYWPWKYVCLTANGKRRTRRHRRIAEPQHTQVLQFLDRHSVSDLVVMKHVSVRGGQLRHQSKLRGLNS